jgi:sucrose-6-phosphate hydrolase SacC (GH32 family)
LVQTPVKELEDLRETRHQLKRVKLDTAAAWMETLNFPAGLAEVDLDLERLPTSGSVELTLQHGTTGITVIRANLSEGTLQVDRTRSGRVDFHPAFPGVHTAPLRVDRGRLRLRVLVDVSSVEVFAQNGETVMTDLILPVTSDLRVRLSAEGAARSLQIRSASLWALRAAPPLNKASLP